MPGEAVVGRAILMAVGELARARRLHAPMASAHEGWAVIKEEMDELWDEVKMRHQDRARLEHEAVQVAAMAMRFLIDVVWKDETERDRGGEDRGARGGQPAGGDSDRGVPGGAAGADPAGE